MKTRVEPMWGISDRADFDEYTWTFKMSGDYRVASGAYAIIPDKDYKALVAALAVTPTQSEPVVTVDKEGVRFGKWCWVSHERITGCEAALIPTKHKQYYEWFLANLRESTNAAPQPDPADHLAAPDSRERAIMPCANLTGCETPRDCSEHGYCRSPRASAPQHEHYDGQNECTICDKAESERTLAKRNAAAKGSVEDAQTVNGSARDADAGSSNAIQDPSFAVPHYHICYSVDEDRAHCVTCGRELPNLAVSAAPKTRLVMGNAGGTNIIAPMPDAPERRIAQRRRLLQPLSEPARSGADRRYNAAGQVTSHKVTDETGGSANPAPAAPTTANPGESALPLKEYSILDRRAGFAQDKDEYGVLLCDQALRAIELGQRVANEQARSRTLVNAAVFATERAEKAEQQLAGLKSEWFRRGQESVRRSNQSGCCCKVSDDDKILSACNAHAEWAGQQLAEKDRGYAILHGQFVEMRDRWKIAFDLKEKAEAEVVELRRAR